MFSSGGEFASAADVVRFRAHSNVCLIIFVPKLRVEKQGGKGDEEENPEKVRETLNGKLPNLPTYHADVGGRTLM